MENSITYLDNILNTKKQIFANIYVNICIYSIYDKSEPYILYLLHKLDNKLYWPHFVSKKDAISEVIPLLKLMDIVKYKYQGYLVENSELYIYIKWKHYIKVIYWIV